MNDLKIIKELKWVKSVKYVDDNLVITTKSNVLKTKLTHYVVPEVSSRHLSKELPVPIVVKLPSYVVTISPSKKEVYDDENDEYDDVEGYEMSIKLARKPSRVNGTYGRVFPTHGLCTSPDMLSEYIGMDNTACLGEYGEDLEECSNDYERALIISQYLQSAIPDLGGIRNRSQWAYSMGIVGDEIIQPVKAPK